MRAIRPFTLGLLMATLAVQSAAARQKTVNEEFERDPHQHQQRRRNRADAGDDPHQPVDAGCRQRASVEHAP